MCFTSASSHKCDDERGDGESAQTCEQAREGRQQRKPSLSQESRVHAALLNSIQTRICHEPSSKSVEHSCSFDSDFTICTNTGRTAQAKQPFLFSIRIAPTRGT
eukprot:gnl/TRDRNA2_/TRDRNA2_169972_c18_seq36.p1 gnl/TRDRNA2_/TRDRNA2_169972_c18~~gnl/TRDRNA2_/TRDRNA2_169972_c18_seq36.p1  ORF type:complete len:104 (-),score=12.17 gnl/TRDRNA2_/TRDRNA2_169972_c18_seq36:729-1040(-)